MCGLNINEEDLNKVYQISYGELEDDKFYAGKEKSIYYHIMCIENTISYKKKPSVIREQF
jgi:hypothetical protein